MLARFLPTHLDVAENTDQYSLVLFLFLLPFFWVTFFPALQRQSDSPTMVLPAQVYYRTRAHKKLCILLE